jgi:hypothetical protein
MVNEASGIALSDWDLTRWEAMQWMGGAVALASEDGPVRPAAQFVGERTRALEAADAMREALELAEYKLHDAQQSHLESPTKTTAMLVDMAAAQYDEAKKVFARVESDLRDLGLIGESDG